MQKQIKKVVFIFVALFSLYSFTIVNAENNSGAVNIMTNVEIGQEDLNYSLNEILKLNPKRILEDDDFVLNIKEVESIAPEVIYKRGGESKIDYEEFILILINAIQEQDKKINILQGNVQDYTQSQGDDLRMILNDSRQDRGFIFREFIKLDNIAKILLVLIAFAILAYICIVTGFVVTFSNFRELRNEIKKIKLNIKKSKVKTVSRKKVLKKE